jgi:hypothetical protein
MDHPQGIAGDDSTPDKMAKMAIEVFAARISFESFF